MKYCEACIIAHAAEENTREDPAQDPEDEDPDQDEDDGPCILSVNCPLCRQPYNNIQDRQGRVKHLHDFLEPHQFQATRKFLKLNYRAALRTMRMRFSTYRQGLVRERSDMLRAHNRTRMLLQQQHDLNERLQARLVEASNALEKERQRVNNLKRDMKHHVLVPLARHLNVPIVRRAVPDRPPSPLPSFIAPSVAPSPRHSPILVDSATDDESENEL
jgi:hypothetical protein